MSGVVEQTAALMGWAIARANVIVEGTSDVAFLKRASELHAAEHGRPILDGDLAVVAAGRGDDGGVDGVNRRLSAFLQLADVDRDATGATRFRFIGLLDNDKPGRRAFITASQFDRRVGSYEDLFLLHPVMPSFPLGFDRPMEVARVNRPFAGMDWEVEDLCSERTMAMLEARYPSAILSSTERGGRTHRELHPKAKPELKRLFIEEATFLDALEFIELLRVLRGYLSLPHDFIKT